MYTLVSNKAISTESSGMGEDYQRSDYNFGKVAFENDIENEHYHTMLSQNSVGVDSLNLERPSKRRKTNGIFLNNGHHSEDQPINERSNYHDIHSSPQKVSLGSKQFQMARQRTDADAVSGRYDGYLADDDVEPNLRGAMSTSLITLALLVPGEKAVLRALLGPNLKTYFEICKRSNTKICLLPGYFTNRYRLLFIIGEIKDVLLSYDCIQQILSEHFPQLTELQVIATRLVVPEAILDAAVGSKHSNLLGIGNISRTSVIIEPPENVKRASGVVIGRQVVVSGDQKDRREALFHILKMMKESSAVHSCWRGGIPLPLWTTNVGNGRGAEPYPEDDLEEFEMLLDYQAQDLKEGRGSGGRGSISNLSPSRQWSGTPSLRRSGSQENREDGEYSDKNNTLPTHASWSDDKRLGLATRRLEVSPIKSFVDPRLPRGHASGSKIRSSDQREMQSSNRTPNFDKVRNDFIKSRSLSEAVDRRRETGNSGSWLNNGGDYFPSRAGGHSFLEELGNDQDCNYHNKKPVANLDNYIRELFGPQPDDPLEPAKRKNRFQQNSRLRTHTQPPQSEQPRRGRSQGGRHSGNRGGRHGKQGNSGNYYGPGAADSEGYDTEGREGRSGGAGNSGRPLGRTNSPGPNVSRHRRNESSNSGRVEINNTEDRTRAIRTSSNKDKNDTNHNRTNNFISDGSIRDNRQRSDRREDPRSEHARNNHVPDRYESRNNNYSNNSNFESNYENNEYNTSSASNGVRSNSGHRNISNRSHHTDERSMINRRNYTSRHQSSSSRMGESNGGGDNEKWTVRSSRDGDRRGDHSYDRFITNASVNQSWKNPEPRTSPRNETTGLNRKKKYPFQRSVSEGRTLNTRSRSYYSPSHSTRKTHSRDGYFSDYSRTPSRYQNDHNKLTKRVSFKPDHFPNSAYENNGPSISQPQYMKR